MMNSSRLTTTKLYYFNESGEIVKANNELDEKDLAFVGKVVSDGRYLLDSVITLKKRCSDSLKIQREMENPNVKSDSGKIFIVEIMFYGSMENCLSYCYANFIEATNDLTSLDSQSSTASRENETAISKNDLMERVDVLERKVESLINICNSIAQKLEVSEISPVDCSQPDRALDLSYQAKFVKSLARARLSDTWRAQIKAFSDSRISSESLTRIKQLFLSSNNNATTFIRQLAVIIFNQDKLKYTIMGKRGKPLKGIKRGIDREIFFKEEDENLLKDIVKLIDKNLFDDEDEIAFEFLVRRIINQLGRDLKKPNPNKRKNLQSRVPMLPITRYFQPMQDN